jgi:hypothetical protein
MSKRSTRLTDYQVAAIMLHMDDDYNFLDDEKVLKNLQARLHLSKAKIKRWIELRKPMAFGAGSIGGIINYFI